MRLVSFTASTRTEELFKNTIIRRLLFPNTCWPFLHIVGVRQRFDNCLYQITLGDGNLPFYDIHMRILDASINSIADLTAD